uniref:Uncharacterized protein n=1 Tax=Arion vulgaris TaxID=1028688 RepID=A0A0B7BFU0_9EUPU
MCTTLNQNSTRINQEGTKINQEVCKINEENTNINRQALQSIKESLQPIKGLQSIQRELTRVEKTSEKFLRPKKTLGKFFPDIRTLGLLLGLRSSCHTHGRCVSFLQRRTEPYRGKLFFCLNPQPKISAKACLLYCTHK